MDNRFYLKVLVAIGSLGIIVLAQSSLQCYQCSPTDTDTDCSNHTLAQLINCSDIFGQIDESSNLKISCYSAYLNYTGLLGLDGNPMDNETGIYRGCGMHSLEFDSNYCDWFSTQMQVFSVTIPFCDSCNASVCNTHIYSPSSDQGGPSNDQGGNNSGNTIYLSFVLWIVSLGLINGY